jgi:CRP-like cAMP-binding protein
MRKALEILGHLHDTDIDWLLEQGAQRHVPPGSVLIEAGVKLHSMYIVLDGQMQVFNVGARVPVATLFAGEILGEISIVDPRPPQVEVRTSTGAHVLDVPRAAIDKRLAEDQAFAARFYFALAAYMAIRLRTTTSRLGYGNAIEDIDPGMLDEKSMDEISVAAAHFNGILQRMRVDVQSQRNPS